MDSGFEKDKSFKHVNNVSGGYSWPLRVLLIFVLAISWTAWKNGQDDRGQAKIQGLAYQVLEIRRKSLQYPRGIATASFVGQGRIGLAPDGQPFHYKLSEDGSTWVVSIWTESDPASKTEVRIQQDRL